MQTAAIIVAAGRGTRAGGDRPKQWQRLGDRTVLAHAVAAFAQHPAIGPMVLVLHPDDLQHPDLPVVPDLLVTAGGATRAASVLAGLARLDGATDQVLIHDGARPLVGAALIDRVLAAMQTHPAAAPALPVTDTLWMGQAGQVARLQDRANLFQAQTPQGFHLPALRRAYDQATGQETDDVAVAMVAGLDVVIVPGDADNIKITLPTDLARATRLKDGSMDIRTGNGYDVHRFGPGDHVWLCGVKIAHEASLMGHSDADVGMHAVTDAIYGALGRGDIGQHFPPSDPQWKGTDSRHFLEHAVRLADDLGYRIGNIDCTLICEEPKIGPHQAAMKAVMGAYMGLDSDRISIKATTSEGLGFTGRKEGIAAMASATLIGR